MRTWIKKFLVGMVCLVAGASIAYAGATTDVTQIHYEYGVVSFGSTGLTSVTGNYYSNWYAQGSDLDMVGAYAVTTNLWGADNLGQARRNNWSAGQVYITAMEFVTANIGYYFVVDHALAAGAVDAYDTATLYAIPSPSVVDNGDGTVGLSWSAATGTVFDGSHSSNIEGYYVWRKANSGSWQQITSTGNYLTTTSYTDSSVSVNGSTGYTYALSLVYYADSSAYVTGSVLSQSSNTVTPSVPAPTISRISRTSGSINGADVIIASGNNLNFVTSVLFGSTSATSYQANSDGTGLAILSPAGTSGSVILTVSGVAGSVTRDYTYEGAPGITSLTPTAGDGTKDDAIFLLVGSNLSSLSTIRFGSRVASAFVDDFEDGDLVANGQGWTSYVGLSQSLSSTGSNGSNGAMQLSGSATNYYMGGTTVYVGRSLDSRSAYVALDVYNAGTGDVDLKVTLRDDDDGNWDYSDSNDDSFEATVRIDAFTYGLGYYHVDIPFTSFSDTTAGGDGVLNPSDSVGGAGFLQFSLDMTGAQQVQDGTLRVDGISFVPTASTTTRAYGFIPPSTTAGQVTVRAINPAGSVTTSYTYEAYLNAGSMAVEINTSGNDLVASWNFSADFDGRYASLQVRKATNPDDLALSSSIARDNVQTTSLTDRNAALTGSNNYYQITLTDENGAVIYSSDTLLAQNYEDNLRYNGNPSSGVYNYNLVGVPYASEYGDAQTLFSALNNGDLTGGSVSLLQRWNSSSQAWEGVFYINGVGYSGTNFSLTDGDPILVELRNAPTSNIVLTGEYVPTVSFSFTYDASRSNYNALALQPASAAYTDAQSLFSSLNSGDLAGGPVEILSKWDNSTSTWQTLFYISGIGYMGTNFTLTEGDAYMVNLRWSLSNWNP